MTIIPLGAALLTRSSDLPGSCGDHSTRLSAPDRHATTAWVWPRIPSLFGLAPCGVYPAPDFTAGAVRSYRTFSPLPPSSSLERLRRYLLCGTSRLQALTPESRTLSGTLSCGVRTSSPGTNSGSDRLATLLSLILRQRGYARPGSWRFIQHRHILRRGSDKYAPSRPGRIVLQVSGDHPCACGLCQRENTHHPDLAMDAATILHPGSAMRLQPGTPATPEESRIARIWNTERLACIPLRWKGSPRFGCSPLE